MRKFGEYDLSKLSDSRLQYMRNPPKFTYIFVIIVIIIIAGAIIWSAFAVKAEEIQTSGIITVSDKYPVTVEVTGTVSEIILNEGNVVLFGDVIFKLDTSEMDIAIGKLESDKEFLESRISYLEKFLSETYKASSKQPFINEGDQREFYVLFAKYLSDKNILTTPEQLEQLNYQIRSSLLTDNSNCTSNLSEVKANLGSYELALSKYTITAKGNGTLHYDSQLISGTFIQAGSLIGSISGSDDKRIIEMYISSADRSKLVEGQECKFTIDGLAQTEYGSLNGKILSISSDALVQQSGVFFRVTVEFDADHISDSKGNKISIVNGMTVRVWVTYEKITYLKYFMEQLGLGDYF